MPASSRVPGHVIGGILGGGVGLVALDGGATVYLYKNAHSDALERLRGLERIEDQTTVAALKRLPKIEGLSCLEVGAGAGSIAAWLAARVGSVGKVLATDIDISHLDSSKYAVLRHDIRKDELPGEASTSPLF